MGDVLKKIYILTNKNFRKIFKKIFKNPDNYKSSQNI